MAKRAGAFKSEKRKKELMRVKKREEKRKKRLSKDNNPETEALISAEGMPTGEEAAEETGGDVAPEKAADDSQQ